METDINKVFRQLSRTEKAKFISQNIDYANSVAVAEYVKSYIFDVLAYIDNDQIVEYLQEQGYWIK